MSLKLEKSLWVSSICPEEINGQRNIPTVILYESKNSVLIGNDALLNLTDERIINREFKVQLGDVVPGGSQDNRKKYLSADGCERTAYEITKDYMDKFLAAVEKKYPRSEITNHKHPAKIVVAEPLSFQVNGHSKQWINYYRENIKRILDRYESVDFLPEPFAVYQYYRYGLRIPHLQDRAKQIAFIIDFGGGTFDACIIESTHEGDISKAGKSSKPLAADSIAVGGFYINRKMAAALIKRTLSDSDKKKADGHIAKYERVLSGELHLLTLGRESQDFIKNFRRLEEDCENYKIELSKCITDWGLVSEAYQKILVKVPESPFSGDGAWIDIDLYAHNLREIFIHEIWNKKLKSVVKSVLATGREALGERALTITLISGGSANLKWLENLLIRDFGDELSEAEPVPVSGSFQEVVANGLAIECARRYYSDESEFVAVTYNPIKLKLEPDSEAQESEYRYRSVNDTIDMSEAKLGDIIPSAQSLRHFFNQSLSWKVKLKKAPKHRLNYTFYRPQGDGDVDAYNVEETSVYTRNNNNMDPYIHVNLTIREDGTATPKFIYKIPNEKMGIAENSVEGKPFHIDMTANSTESQPMHYYVGFDFGTSNSSVCLLSQEKIKITKRRQESITWNGISAASSQLPFPVAIAVKRFLSIHDQSRIVHAAIEAFEAALAFMAYTAASEINDNSRVKILLEKFHHRSLGPLSDLLASSLKILGKNAVFSSGFDKLFSVYNTEFRKAIDDLTQYKHQKKSFDDANWQDYVELIVRVLTESLGDKKFGYCSNSVQEAFDDGFNGTFIQAHDTSPFVNTFSYSASENIRDSLAIIYDPETNSALGLTPFIFWFDRPKEDLTHACYWIDRPMKDGDNVEIKPCDKAEAINASALNTGLGRSVQQLFNDGKRAKHVFDITITIVKR